jgi:hypothetical protein
MMTFLVLSIGVLNQFVGNLCVARDDAVCYQQYVNNNNIFMYALLGALCVDALMFLVTAIREEPKS